MNLNAVNVPGNRVAMGLILRKDLVGQYTRLIAEIKLPPLLIDLYLTIRGAFIILKTSTFEKKPVADSFLANITSPPGIGSINLYFLFPTCFWTDNVFLVHL